MQSRVLNLGLPLVFYINFKIKPFVKNVLQRIVKFSYVFV